MNGFWYEIRHGDGELVQNITTLTASEMPNLKSAGFIVVPVTAPKALLGWLRPIAWGE